MERTTSSSCLSEPDGVMILFPLLFVENRVRCRGYITKPNGSSRLFRGMVGCACQGRRRNIPVVRTVPPPVPLQFTRGGSAIGPCKHGILRFLILKFQGRCLFASRSSPLLVLIAQVAYGPSLVVVSSASKRQQKKRTRGHLSGSSSSGTEFVGCSRQKRLFVCVWNVSLLGSLELEPSVNKTMS
ncbi:hypothetical protein FN846DRAFT_210213 [Sphaerosporella brunnea]|uniref:Uncharacterized protein n=1 Tax=Sphaerosporella brunnea TaxID=1250544 RepID=A0A5J5EQD7_9PEZI|nr:hypothetical protein FN846DRAFT_210213 [Sphaerosporella brunnea]